MEQTAVSAAEPAEDKAEALGTRQAERESPLELFHSAEANALRAEIIRIGRKLWERQYVDGNGGNISVRLGAEFVLCTPTMMSKADLETSDICLSDLSGKILAGDRTLTSELLLHLEIYKANPKARAVVHCHPPYATAFAIAGTAPPNGLIPEYEVLIGPAAVASYETPGTQAFAETILPFVHEHNTILLKNHGVVCWSDTVTHAEWLCEVMDTYCKTYLIAKQIGEPLGVIPDDKIDDILLRKQWMGLPDARMGRIGGDPRGGDAKNNAEIVELVKRETGRMKARG
ncbi:MAG TPA: class II aldolase/adducin family protein [Terracidiphilus sp.]|nr:class II aldolase/adducin family protein [Terracidiphilus sp.]